MRRRLLVSTAIATAATTIAAPAYANDRTARLKGSGAVHSVLKWDDSVDTLCLTLRSRAPGAVANADLRLASGGFSKHLSVSKKHPRACTKNLSIAEDRLATMRLYGGTNTWWKSSGWVQFYT